LIHFYKRIRMSSKSSRKKERVKEKKKYVRKMNEVGDKIADEYLEGRAIQAAVDQGDHALADDMMSIGMEAHQKVNTILQDIRTGRRKVPVTYERGDSSLVYGRKASVMKQMWATGIDYLPHDRDFKHLSPLLVACYLGNYSDLIALIKDLSPEKLSLELRKRETMMEVSAVFHPIIGAKTLIPGLQGFKRGVMEETVRVYGRPELRHIKVLQKLLDIGADVNVQDFAGYTPLHHCLTCNGSIATLEMAKMLIQKGAEVNTVNRFNCTPLFDPVMSYKMEAINLLIENGADPHIKDVNGISPYEYGAMIPAVGAILKLRKTVPPKVEKPEVQNCTVCSKSCMMRCSGCFLTWYCTSQCQKADWSNHKEMCKARKAAYQLVTFNPEREMMMRLSSMQISQNSKPARFHCVVKVVPVGGTNDILSVYSKDQSINGWVDYASRLGSHLLAVVRSKGVDGTVGFFHAIKNNKSGEVYINPNILPPEQW